MIDTILIANRGEIACRIIRTARALGLRSVAVYSEVDAGALHVEMADLAVPLGGQTPVESYLRGDAILAAAKATGAQAIHPGYGFLSENPDFVDAVAAAGLTFIGPSADAIRAMGLKDAAKALMEQAGVPVVPGDLGADQDPAHLAARADDIGYPVLIKAVAGGGGKGMRRVDDRAAFSAALEAARREAAAAFGNDHVLIEKFVAKPRHIEVQVFGDGTDALHLFERDCSLQRRHQKVIEEAPAPGMTPQMRAAMGEAAVRAAKAIGYSGAGTVEFIVDASDGLRPDRFYFMEMNTRLQVEHPVTELITGVDLVAWQLRVAAGETLQDVQTDLQSGLHIDGHAFEARLYAEDVPKGFLPATGQLAHLTFAADARTDTGVRAGDVISPFYDPMIAKIIVHGPTRDVALARLRRALADTQVAGTTTNLGFLSALAAHEGFAAGDVDTGLIDRDLDALVRTSGGDDDMPPDLHWIAAGMRANGLDEPPARAGFALWTPQWQHVRLAQGAHAPDLSVTCDGADRQTWRVDGRETLMIRRQGKWWAGAAPLPDAAVAGATATVFAAAPVVFDIPDPLAVGTEAAGDGTEVEAPMPGLVKDVFVTPGQTVSEGDALAILEAMKMEHTLTARRDATVEDVLARPGDQVEAGAVLVRLSPEAEG